MNSLPRKSEPLAVQEVRMAFPGSGEVLKGVSLEVGAGESAAVVGPSGSGKSTLLNVVGSLEAPTGGKVWLGELEVTALSGKALAEYRARKVGFVFQDHHLLPQCTALENVLLPTLTAPDLREGGEERGRELLGRVGLGDRADAYPAELSGGERQRVAVARALVNRPSLLLCDEPTGNLDRETGRRIMELFGQVSAETGATLLVVTHDEESASRLGQRFALRDGELVDGGGHVST